MFKNNRQLSSEQISQLDKVYAELAQQFPSSFVVKRIWIDIVDNERFKEHVQSLIIRYIHSGIPSLFSTLKVIYKKAIAGDERSQARVSIIGEVMKSILDSIKSSNKIPGEEANAEPSALMWILFFLSQHEDLIGNQVSISSSLFFCCVAYMN